MKLIDAAGNEQRINLPGPGGTIRIAVGEQGHRSSTWRVWSNKNTSDVYVAARTIGGTQKFSLHESGDWRHQWVSTEKARQHGDSDQRIMDQWERPETPEHGFTKGLSIWVPHGHLDLIENDRDSPDDVYFIPDAPSGAFAGIHISVASPDRGLLELGDATPIAAYGLASGEAVVTLSAQMAITDDQEANLRDAIAKAYFVHMDRGSSLMEYRDSVEAPRLLWTR